MKRALIILILCIFCFTAYSAIGETTFVFSNAEDDEELNDTGMWELRYYQDEFKRPTDEGYICNSEPISGTFNNSAASNSSLSAFILVDKENVSILLAEYGRSQVKNGSTRDDETYNITMLDPAGNKISLSATLYALGNRLFIAKYDAQKVIKALSQNASVSFYIVHSERSINNYTFTIEDTSYFSTAYDLLRK